jgi:hypothetical protein
MLGSGPKPIFTYEVNKAALRYFKTFSPEIFGAGVGDWTGALHSSGMNF